MPSISAERVRRFRKKRKSAGHVEIRAWVITDDVEAAHSALAPFVERANTDRFMQAMEGPEWRKDAFLRHLADWKGK